MAGVTQIPRSRGSLCGLLLMLLGAWGGLAPFVGPYFDFGFTPDKAWAYTSGRLYLSVVPGAAALIGGLFVLMTRSRTVGIVSGLLAALGGAWFVVGYGTVVEVLKNLTISPGLSLQTSTQAAADVLPSGLRVYAEQLAFFTGLGILIVFLAALAIARFSMIAAKDASAAGSMDYGTYQPAQADPFTGAGPADEVPQGQDQYPTSTSPFPPAQPPAQQQFPASAAPFPPAPPPQDQFPTSGG